MQEAMLCQKKGNWLVRGKFPQEPNECSYCTKHYTHESSAWELVFSIRILPTMIFVHFIYKLTQLVPLQFISKVLILLIQYMIQFTQKDHKEEILITNQKEMFNKSALHLQISLIILLTVCHIVLVMLVSRIWYWIN